MKESISDEKPNKSTVFLFFTNVYENIGTIVKVNQM